MKMSQVDSMIGDLLAHSQVEDWPALKTLKHYVLARDSYVNRIKQNKAVRAVFQIGSVNTPGISDLDLIVVIKQGINTNFSRFSINNISSQDRYIIMHEPLVVDENLFKNLYRIFPYFDLAQAYGDVYDKPRTNIINHAYALCFLAEYSLTKIPRILVEILIIPQRISARLALVLINSVCHSITLLKLAGGKVNSAWQNFFDRFGVFRQSCPQKSQTNERLLKDFIIEATIISFEVIEQANNILKESLVNPELFRKNINAELNGFFSARFISQWSIDIAVREAIFTANRGRLTLVLPTGFLDYFSFVARCSGCLGSFISQRISHNSRKIFKNEVLMKDHIKAIDEYIYFSRKIKYRGSIFITLGAGDNFVVRTGRWAKVQLRCLKYALTISRLSKKAD